MSRRVRAAVQRAAGIVVLDFEVIAAGLAKIDRVGEVSALRLGDLAEVVFFFVRFDIFPRRFDFLVARDAKAVMIVEGLFRRVGTAFVNDQAPVGVRMFQRGFAGFLLDDFHRQKIGEDR